MGFNSGFKWLISFKAKDRFCTLSFSKQTFKLFYSLQQNTKRSHLPSLYSHLPHAFNMPCSS